MRASTDGHFDYALAKWRVLPASASLLVLPLLFCHPLPFSAELLSRLTQICDRTRRIIMLRSISLMQRGSFLINTTDTTGDNRKYHSCLLNPNNTPPLTAVKDLVSIRCPNETRYTS